MAGTGAAGFSGDGGAATAAQLNRPSNVALDSSGNLYIADTGNQRIRRVDANGTITTVAGTGAAGFSGDGGAATAAQLDFPTGAALDGSGNLYIADTGNQRIRKVDAGGTITTAAGTGTQGSSGDGGAATAAQLNNPIGVALDGSGNLYLADTRNHRIRKVDAGGTITTAAGAETQGSRGVGGRATEAQLDFPLTWWWTTAPGTSISLIPAITASSRSMPAARSPRRRARGAMASEGMAVRTTAARLRFPHGVAVDGSGNLFIADTRNHRIRKVGADGTITTVAGTGTDGFGGDSGPASAAQLNRPAGVAVDGSGNLFIADTNNHRIRKVDAEGTITTVAGTRGQGFSGDSGPATAAQLNGPHGVAVDGSGNLFIADTNNHRIRKVNAGGMITTVAGTGTAIFSGDGRPATAAQLNGPHGVAVDGSGNLFIADTSNHRIRKVDTRRTITTVAGTGTAGFSGDSGPASDAQLNGPHGVAVDGFGNLFIADTNNHRIRLLTPPESDGDGVSDVWSRGLPITGR